MNEQAGPELINRGLLLNNKSSFHSGSTNYSNENIRGAREKVKEGLNRDVWRSGPFVKFFKSVDPVLTSEESTEEEVL